MTEVPFLFFAAAGLLMFRRYLETGRAAWLLGSSAALGYAYLIRQTALLYIAAVAVVLVLRRGIPAARFLAPAGVAVAAYQAWLAATGGPTAAARRKFELLDRIGAEQIVGNSLGLAFYVAFMLLPALVWLAPELPGLWRAARPRSRVIALCAGLALAVAGVAWFGLRYGLGPYLPSAAYHARMPFLLNVLYDTGLGPLTLDPTYYGPPPTPTYPALWRFVTLATAGAVVLLALVLLLGVARRLRDPFILACMLALAFTALFEVVFSHLEEGGLFDRHITAAALPALLLIAAVAESPPPATPRRASRAAAAALIVLFAAFSIAATHDYLAWNRARWELGRVPLERGVDTLAVSGGFEWNAWHNYDVFRARGGVEKVFYWWYDDRAWLIAMAPESGYTVAARRDWFSWVHRRSLPVLLLRRTS